MGLNRGSGLNGNSGPESTKFPRLRSTVPVLLGRNHLGKVLLEKAFRGAVGKAGG